MVARETRQALNNQIIWIVAQNDVLRKPAVVRLNIIDFIDAYEHALDDLADRFLTQRF